MGLQKDLKELVEAEVISEGIATRIDDFYRNRGAQSGNKLFIAFGLFGAILVGLGLILIIAHNWDKLSLAVKTMLAFLPVIGSQLLCAFSMVRRKGSAAWKESSATLLILSLGASMAMLSQIYQIPGHLDSFLLTWILLSLPVIYIVHSSMASLLCLIGITAYACEIGYWSHPVAESYLCWALLACIIPYYILLWQKTPRSNFTKFHHWFLPGSIVVMLGTIAYQVEEWMFVAYVALFGILYLVGHLRPLARETYVNNGYLVMGFFGTIITLLILSFHWFWENLEGHQLIWYELVSSREFLASVLLTLIASSLLYILRVQNKEVRFKLLLVVFLIFPGIFMLGYATSLAAVLVNLLLLAIGVSTVRTGALTDHLGVLNLGMMVITALIICRFFDTDISFVMRGILFVCVGIGFFMANHLMLRKRA